MTDRDECRGRVTIDIDGYVDNFELTALRAYHNLRRAAEHVDVHVSSGEGGLHIIGYFESPKSFPERIHLRRMLGDDQKRINIDIQRFKNGVYTGVLWDQKSRNGSGTKHRDFEDIHDALAFVNRDKNLSPERIKRFAEYGHKRAPELTRHAEGL